MSWSNPGDILSFHRFLLRDTGERLKAYERAIRRAVRPGSVVLDLGAGTGIIAFLAFQAGARRVYAVEVGDVAEFAKLLMRGNGVSDRVSVLQGFSPELQLPEQVDVIVADIFGTFGMQSGGLTSLLDARQRMLKPGGTMLPEAIDLFIAPVEAAEFYHDTVDFWGGRVAGMDLSALRPPAVNTQYPVRFEERMLLGPPARLAHLRLSEFMRPDIHGVATTPLVKDGLLHGLCGWFAAHFGDDIVLTNAPATGTTNYAQTFLPIEQPVGVERGGEVNVALDHLDGEILRWRVDVLPRSRGEDPGAEPRHFDHSTFLGAPLSLEGLRKPPQPAPGP